jgi:hypothetical protein
LGLVITLQATFEKALKPTCKGSVVLKAKQGRQLIEQDGAQGKTLGVEQTLCRCLTVSVEEASKCSLKFSIANERSDWQRYDITRLYKRLTYHTKCPKQGGDGARAVIGSTGLAGR